MISVLTGDLARLVLTVNTIRKYTERHTCALHVSPDG